MESKEYFFQISGSAPTDQGGTLTASIEGTYRATEPGETVEALFADLRKELENQLQARGTLWGGVVITNFTFVPNEL